MPDISMSLLALQLKACPFCGGKAFFLIRIAGSNHSSYYDVGCKNVVCFLASGAEWYFARPEEALRAWNVRSAPLPTDLTVPTALKDQARSMRIEFARSSASQYILSGDVVDGLMASFASDCLRAERRKISKQIASAMSSTPINGAKLTALLEEVREGSE